MRELAIRELAEQRNTPLRLGELRTAQAELELASAEDEEVRHTWRIPDGYPWMRDWVKEVEPALAYSRHLEIGDSALACWLNGVSGKDFVLESSPGLYEAIEITGTYNYHDRLTDEMLNEVGWVASTTPKSRNRISGCAEYCDEDRMDDAEDILSDWAKRIEHALRGKQRPDYGIGATLIVSCRGVDHDLKTVDRDVAELLSRVPADAKTNSFNRTILMGWQKGFFLEL